MVHLDWRSHRPTADAFFFDPRQLPAKLLTLADKVNE
jgi:hypothetical protein